MLGTAPCTDVNTIYAKKAMGLAVAMLSSMTTAPGSGEAASGFMAPHTDFDSFTDYFSAKYAAAPAVGHVHDATAKAIQGHQWSYGTCEWLKACDALSGDVVGSPCTGKTLAGHTVSGYCFDSSR